MDPKFYSCRIPQKTAPAISYFKESEHSDADSRKTNCSKYSLQGEHRTIVSSPYTDSSIPKYANLSRIDDITGLVGQLDGFRYVGVDGAEDDFDLYIHYKRFCIAFVSSITPYSTGFDPMYFMIIPGQGGDRAKEIRRYVKISTSKVNLFYSAGSLLDVDMALSFLSPGGNALFLLPGLFDKKECSDIACCSHAFRKICLFKPVSSNVNSTSCYLVCFHFLGNPRPDRTLTKSLFKWISTQARTLHEELTIASSAKYNQTFLYTSCQIQK